MSSSLKMLANLDPLPSDVRKWRILLLVSAVNSLTQRMQTYLADMGCTRVSTELALSDETMVSAVLAHSPHLIICPFLTKKVPDVVYSNVSNPPRVPTCRVHAHLRPDSERVPTHGAFLEGFMVLKTPLVSYA